VASSPSNDALLKVSHTRTVRVARQDTPGGVFSRFLTLRQLSGPALPGRTVTGCVILRNSHVIRVAARRVRLTREIPAYTRRSTGQWRLRVSPARVARTRQDGN